MSIGLLTIDSIFAGPISVAPAPPGLDAAARGRISFGKDDGPPKMSFFQTQETDNVPTDTTKAVSDKPSREFREVLGEKTAGDVPARTHNDDESQDQTSLCDPAGPKDIAQTWLAGNGVSVQQSKDGAAGGVEPGAGRQPAQPIASSKAHQPPPPTGHAAKSAQIKLLHATEKGQLGIKTVLPEKSHGLNGLKTALPETAKVMPAAKAQPGTEEKTDKTVKPDETASGTRALANKGNAKALTPEASANAGGKTPAAGGTTALVNAGIVPVQAATAENQSQPMARHGPAVLRRIPHASENAAATVVSPGGKESAQRESGLSNARGLQKLNVTEVQVSADQSSSRGRSAADNRSGQSLAPTLAPNGPQVPMAQHPASSSASARTASLPGQTPGDVRGDVAKQILESIHGSLPQQGGDRQITVHLNPPELGKVFIRFQEQNSQLVGSLEVSRTQTRFEIEHDLPQIVRNLAECGIQIRRLDVVLADQGRPEQDTLGGQSPPNGGPYEHDSANQERMDDARWRMDDLSVVSRPSSLAGLQEALITDSSINMLI